METPEHQEFRARQRVSVPAVVKAALLTGLVLFVMSGRGPWSTAGTMNVIMGRDVKLPLIALAGGHFFVSLIYMFIIAFAIYRLPTWIGGAAGVGVALVLYGLNFAIFRGLGLEQQSPEGRTLFVHLVFGLIGSGVYKAFAVPKPLRGNAQPSG